jgi:hypothetical protein
MYSCKTVRDDTRVMNLSLENVGGYVTNAWFSAATSRRAAVKTVVIVVKCVNK